MGFKRGSQTEFLPALGAGANIGLKHLIPTLSKVLRRGTGRFGRKSVVKNANEILWDELLRIEAAWGIRKSGFNTCGENTCTPGMSGSGPSKNFGGEAFLREGIILVVD